MVPDGLDERSIYRFTDGFGKPGGYSVAAGIIVNELSDSSEAIALVESGTPERNDPVVSTWEFRKAFCENEVYGIVTKDSATTEGIVFIMKAMESLVICNVFVGDVAPKWSADGLSELAFSWVDKLSERIRLVAVGAYDGESFVIWRRQR